MDKHIPVSLTCRKCETKLQWPDDASDSTEIKCQKCGEHFGPIVTSEMQLWML
jgi:DNA-directed RNA polymerase subunit RPC12/RpoP